MFRSIVLVLSLLGIALARSTPDLHSRLSASEHEGRDISQNLYIDNPYNAGKWGLIELCANGSFASAIEIKYSPPGHLDETAINAVRLYCTTPEGHNTGYISSSEGPHGDWYGMQICSNDYVTGFRANVLKKQGAFVDDVAVEDFQIDCNYGMEIVDAIPVPVPADKPTPFKFKSGTWSSFSTCRNGLAVCGLQTRLDDPIAAGDSTAVADVVFFCCDRN